MMDMEIGIIEDFRLILSEPAKETAKPWKRRRKPHGAGQWLREMDSFWRPMYKVAPEHGQRIIASRSTASRKRKRQIQSLGRKVLQGWIAFL
jgi:hypothetical protein